MVAIRHRALQLLAIGLLAGGSAFAQDLSCSLIGTQQNVRAEGKTELLGDINIECVAADPNLVAAPWATKQVNIIVNLPVNVTNNINFGEGTNVTDARLIVNDSPQLYGVRTANKEVAFDDVTVPFPGFFGNPDKTVIRISSIRGNVTQLGLPSEGNVIQIDAIVSTEPPSTLSVGVPSVTIGFSRLSLLSEGVSNDINGLQCVDLNEEEQPYLTIREGFASAWKTQGTPSDAKNTFWESGYYAEDSNNGAGASQETQFRLSFSTIPDDVTLQLDEQITDGDDLVLTLLSVNGVAVNDLCDGTEGDLVSVSHAGGTATAVYGVCDNNPNSREEIDIPLPVSWDVDDTPDVGAGTVTISYWPLNGSDFSSLNDPEPRFVDTASSPEEFVSVTKCVTTLLFPFVTNQAGFDTGMAISNTSEDWGLSGIEGQDGACEVHYIGTDSSDNTPEVDVTTDDVLAGEQLVWLLSAGGSHGLVGAPDFQGYILAACDFQYAHGYAFITDGFGGGIPALAQGYLALVIPADRGISNGEAESLGH